MSVIVIAPPEPVVTLAQAKRHLRVEHGDDDAYITDLAAVAQGTIDGPDGWLGRSLGPQTLELRLFCFRDAFTLPCGPVLSVEAMRYVDGSGVERLLDPAEYELRGWVVGAAFGRRFPSARENSIRVRYRAGYAPTTDDPPKPTLPAPIRHAILLMVGDLYGNRESGGVGSGSFEYKMPTTIEALLAPFRAWRV